MTSRKANLNSMDELDDLIRWAMLDQMQGVKVPSRAWERVYARVHCRKETRSGFRLAVVQVLEVSALLLAQIIAFLQSPNTRTEWYVEPHFTRFLVDQYHFFLLQLAF